MLYYVIVFIVCFIVGFSTSIDAVGFSHYVWFDWVGLYFACTFFWGACTKAPIRTVIWNVLWLGFLALTYLLNGTTPTLVMFIWAASLPIITTLYFWKWVLIGFGASKLGQKLGVYEGLKVK